MKLTKFFTLGLAVVLSFSLTSCFNDDEDSGESYSYYTDYMDFNTTGTQATADDGTSYTIENSSEIASYTSSLTDGRAFFQFKVTYDASGNMVGGFQVMQLSNCYVVDAVAEDPTIDKARQLVTVNSTYSGVTNKYLNLFVTEANVTSSIVNKDMFEAYVTKVDGNSVYVSLCYNNAETNFVSTISQPVSIDISGALEEYRSEIKPDSDGKITVVLNNDNNVTGSYSWE